jgi:hypothetical protein
MRSIRGFIRVLLVLGVLGLPTSAFAQSAIAGVVKDTSGAVLPGVTVEASSPVLIEKSRSATTDSEGRYQIIDLRPGIYTVTFSLEGFNAFKRDGIDLPSNFTAPVNADLTVGSLQETVTVSGQSPVVDVQNAVQQVVMTRALIDAVPTGRSIQTLSALLPGARLALPDVGGNSGMQNRDISVHGSDGRDMTFMVDGMVLNGIEGDGSVQSYYNNMIFEEVTYQTSGISAETSAGGVRANMIPKDGGNTFRGTLFATYGNQALQSNNLSQDLINRGLAAPDALFRIWDFNVAEGGPILHSRLWFFSSYRDWGVYQYIANSFFGWGPKGPGTDPGIFGTTNGKQTVDDASIRSGMTRFTLQATPKNKVAFYWDKIRKFRGHENSAGAGVIISGEATDIRAPKPRYTTESKWTSTITNRLLFEAGYALDNETYTLEPLPESVGVIPKRDITQNTLYGAYDFGYYYREPKRRTIVSSMSYVTGSHAVKVGIQYGFGYFFRSRVLPADMVQRYRNGVPDSVFVYNTPQNSQANMDRDMGIYAQDSWTFGHVTLTPGVRYENFIGSVHAEDSPAGRFVPARHFDTIDNLPNWKDVSPRFGIAWDVQGNGKTAVKFGIGKYMRAYTTGFADSYDPNILDTDTRTWTDANGDNIAEISELGPSQNKTFGIKAPRRPADGIRRPYQIEMNASVQREILTGFSVNFSYFRRDYKQNFSTDNVAVAPSDYTALTLTSPLDGAPVTIYNLNPAKLGAIDLVDQNSATNYRKYGGYDAGFNARVKKLNVFGGISTGRTISNTCDVEDPNQLLYCDQSKYHIPYATQVKIAGSYALPWALEASGALQSYPGDARNSSVDTGNSGNIAAEDPSLRVNWTVNNTIVRAQTGQTLTQSQIVVPLIPPGTKFLGRQNQIDVRLKRVFPFKGKQIEAQFDVFNALNANPILTVNQTYGTALDRPASVLQGRLIRLGLQAKF